MGSRFGRISTLIVPPVFAAMLAMRVDREVLLHTVAPVLVMMWIFMIGTLVMRYVEGLEHRGPYTKSHWEHVDVLTSSGSAVMWLSCVAIFAARATGWASLSVVGILGFGTMFVTVS